ncbi:MAG: hypothetical protein MK207_14630 [Saprospiraceae bacterium]|nr:hypothetical protein [Saprospiraceae bacterium]
MSEKNKTNVLHWNGTPQNERLLKSLLPESIKVDERSVSDILAFASKFSEIIKYYDLTNTPVGDWGQFFKKDVSMFLATIVSTDLHKIEKEHSRLINILDNSPRAEGKLEALEGLMQQILELAKQINDWYVDTMQMDRLNMMNSSELENELENAIKQQLAENLMDLLLYQEDLGFNETGPFSAAEIKDNFHYNWFKKHEQIGARDIILKDKGSADKIKDYSKKIRIQFRIFYSVTAYILQIAPKYLVESLTKKSDHRPDIALFISFAKMFKKLQNQINTITEKHLDFYYYNILKQKQKGLTPDKANVFFNVATHIDTHFLEKGTFLTAGKDEDGVEHLYTTDYDLELNQAKIESIKTLYISKNPKIGIGSSYRVITNLYAADVANSKDGKGGRFINNEENWPTFGHEILELPKDEQQMDYAQLGWAIAAPILEMEEGHRIVTMRFDFVPSTMYTLNLLIKDISINQDISREDAFSKIFKNSLEVFFTTSEGWLSAHSCEVLPPDDWGKSEITIVATLSDANPSIINYDPETMGEGYSAESPIVKISQRSEGSFFSYSFLKELEVKNIAIDVDVKGIRQLMLSSDIGGISSNVPFQPFGAIPKVGSYFIVGKEELFKKDITDLQFNIEWHSLPTDKKGFRGYFKDYGLSIKNEQYEMKLSALSDGSFSPSKDEEPLIFKMFEPQDDNPHGIKNKTTITDIDIEALNIKADDSFVMPPMFNNEARAGFFKLEFSGPLAAFGHESYAGIYAKKVKYNNMPKRKGPEKTLPKQPVAPVMKTITMDYSASAEINVLSIGTLTKGEDAREQIYHIHPFGITQTFSHGLSKNRMLIPNYDDNAYLYLGLKDLIPPSTLSLYFELKENLNLFTDGAAKKHKPEIIWSYMVKDEWKDFSQNTILTDTTNGFNNSGIVNLEIPRDLTDDNTILPDTLHWLRVTIKGDPDLLPRCLTVATQALSVTWVDNGSSDKHLLEPLPANSIKKLASSISQIRGVSQPFPTFGGRPGETKLGFYTRTSERLRHKNRAVSAWDYERLVLDKFPGIHQVKCVTHVGNEEYVGRGSVSLVVVPKIDKKIKGYHLPMVNHTVLDAIKKYLEQLSSPFVNIEVRNPIYERVKISAGLRFVQGKNNGTYLKKLNQDIIEFMCPWMLGEEQELELGGILVKDVILSFIEKCDYVDFVTKFSAVQVFPQDGGGFDVDDTAIHSTNSPLIKATKPWSILIPFEQNPLYFLDDDSFQLPEKSSISSMIIDGDFVMTEEKDRDLDDFLSDKRRKKDIEEEED